MLTSLKALFLSIVLFFLNIPYGIDAPTRAFIQSSSLEQTALVCEQSETGAEATFTLSMKQDYRAIRPTYAFDEFNVKLFDSMEGIDMSKSGAHYENFQVLSKWGADDYPYDAAWSVEIKDAADIIKVGDTFTLVVHLKIGPTVPVGTYHIAVSPNYAQECIYPNALILK